MAAFAAAHVMK